MRPQSFSARHGHPGAARRLLACLSALAIGLGLAACGSDDDLPLQVSTRQGAVEGLETDTGYQYLGIPYAAPPVGALRWAAPQPAASWSGIRPAQAYGNHCPQAPTPGMGYGFAGGQEDCLYLNVFRPKKPGPHPVMVWIHGGAFVLGRSNSYTPTRMVERDVVVVTLNYRLGSLGYLSHPALADAQGRSGNYGFLDQIAALKWVQANIASFGGDPNNVTLFGQSAGGLSVQAQLASPLAKGLFHKAIVQSAPGLTLQSQAAANTLGATIAARAPAPAVPARGATPAVAAVTGFNCPNDAKAASCLRGLSVDYIIANQPGSFSPVNQPVVDGNFLTQDMYAAFDAGNFNKVPIMSGTVHDEFTSFMGQTELRNGAPMSAAAYPFALAGQFTSPPAPAGFATLLATQIYPLSAYPGSTGPSLAFSAAVADGLFSCAMRKATKQFQKAGVPVYSYEFNDPNAPMTLQPLVSFPYKAYHAAEIQYLFDVPGSTLTAAQKALADTLVAQWTQFARTGNPSGAGNVVWPAYGSTESVLSLAPVGTGAGTVVTTGFAADHKCAIWTPGV
ncbi:MAG: carboxylesterase family protein [Burkholderiales bacterium]|nr:carboxylesterase family protein [Burkholderiales bacterium]